MRRITGLAAVVMAMGGAGAALASGPFDGTWNAVVDCPAVGDVDGYTWRFPVRVQDGKLSGKWSSPSDPQNFGELGGTIAANGDAELMMTGSTGPEAYSVQHVRPHMLIRWRANAHFEKTSGAGKRVEQRPCDLSFSKN